MFAGDAFTVDQRRGIEKAIRDAEAGSGLAFCVRMGGLAGVDAAAEARALLHRMPDPARSVVVVVDPAEHAIEIVTGSLARQTLTDADCHEAAVAMQGSFRAGDLPGGLMAGIQDLGKHAATTGRHSEVPTAADESTPLSGASVRPTH